MEYIVIKCSNCQSLTFIRSNQKTFTCKNCGTKNDFEKIKTFPKAKMASEYIQYVNTQKFGPGDGFFFLR